MAKKRFSGLDELMIVNPGLPNEERTLQLGQVFLGEDGRLYCLGRLQETESLGQLAEYYLGEDGTLYQLQSFDPFHEPYLRQKVRNSYNHYFLGEGGKLYQVIR